MRISKPYAQRIKSTRTRLEWLDARGLVESRGGLPPHGFLDNQLVSLWPELPRRHRDMLRSFRHMWAREVIAYPPSGQRFTWGTDIVSPSADKARRSWVIPWADLVTHIDPVCVRGPRIGLFVDPGIREENVQIERYRARYAVVIHPVSVAVLNPFIQTYGEVGKVDEKSGLPLAITAQDYIMLQDGQKRKLYRVHGIRISPLFRSAYCIGNGRYCINASYLGSPLYEATFLFTDKTERKPPRPMLSPRTLRKDARDLTELAKTLKIRLAASEESQGMIHSLLRKAAHFDKLARALERLKE